MKIGIMTYWWSEDNYGQVLQCFALQKYLRDAGHDAYLIRYLPDDIHIKTRFLKKIQKAFNPVKLIRYLFNKILNLIDKEKNKFREFSVFREKYLVQSEKIYHSYNELLKEPPDAEVYIVGSDQVWHFGDLPLELVKERLKCYFLDFGNKKVKRISYAASFGKEKLNDDFISEIFPLLSKFDYISVRENAGIDICHQYGIETAELAPDPTLLLDTNEYRSLYKDVNINAVINAPFLLLYILGSLCDFSFQAVYDWAKEKGINIIYISGNGMQDKYKKLYATIPQWLYLIDHAEYVITNSYHCSIFSFLYQKKFGVIPLTGYNSGMNTRFTTLFELLGMKNGRFITDNFAILDNDIEWYTVSNVIKNIRTACSLLDIINNKIKII
jgi:hypothetical protein